MDAQGLENGRLDFYLRAWNAALEARRTRPMRTLFSICTSTLLSLMLCSCAVSAPFVVALPNGYYLQRNKTAQIMLVKRGGAQVLRGPIAAYDVHRNLVVGCVGTWPPRAFSYPNESPFPESAPARYFVLDTVTGKLDSDLDLETWKKRLGEAGVGDVRITAPILPT